VQTEGNETAGTEMGWNKPIRSMYASIDCLVLVEDADDCVAEAGKGTRDDSTEAGREIGIDQDLARGTIAGLVAANAEKSRRSRWRSESYEVAQLQYAL
jgi:hypothetical protein